MSDPAISAAPARRLRTRMSEDAFWYRQRGATLSALVFAAMLAFFAVFLPDSYFSLTNLGNLTGQLVPLFLVAIGQTFVLLAAGFDLSVGSVISLSTAIFTLNLHPAVSIPLGFGAAALVGLANGIGCVHLKVHPIIMTLATGSIVQGIALIILPTPGGFAPPVLIGMATGSVLGLPAALFWILAAVGISVWMVHGTSFGVWLYSVGQNQQAAWFSGLNAPMIRVSTYLISSLLAACAGAYLTGRLASGDPNVGTALGLDSVLGAALGGTLLSGGVGGPVGTVFGVLIIGSLNNGMNLANVSPFYQYIVKGTMLIVAVSLFRRKEAGL